MSAADKLTMCKDSLSETSSDLVSQFLAATPSYLYNISSNSSNFFFSEMLRSLVQAKNNTFSSDNVKIRNRKRSWKDLCNPSLELTVNSLNPYQTKNHISTLEYDKFRNQIQIKQSQQQQNFFQHNHFQYSNENQLQNEDIRRNHFQKVINSISKEEINNSITKNMFLSENEQLGNDSSQRILSKSEEEISFSSVSEKLINDVLDNTQNKQKSNYADQIYLQASKNMLADGLDGSTVSKFTSNIISNSKILDLSNQLQYPCYSLAQNNPAIDPLHFFVDLHVSRHILDQKDTVRSFLNKSKHNSAFRIPKVKEHNRPLNLTRKESNSIRSTNKNFKGTPYILKNLAQMYKKIWNTKNYSRSNEKMKTLSKLILLNR
jgi:hypothetical protein